MKRNKNVHFGFIFSSSSPSIFSFSFSVQIPISSLQSKFSYFFLLSIFRFIWFVFENLFRRIFSVFIFELFYELQFLRILNILILVTFQLPKVYFNKILFLARLCRIQPFSLFFAPTLNRLDLEPGHYIEKFETFKLIGPEKMTKIPSKNLTLKKSDNVINVTHWARKRWLTVMSVTDTEPVKRSGF